MLKKLKNTFFWCIFHIFWRNPHKRLNCRKSGVTSQAILKWNSLNCSCQSLTAVEKNSPAKKPWILKFSTTEYEKAWKSSKHVGFAGYSLFQTQQPVIHGTHPLLRLYKGSPAGEPLDRHVARNPPTACDALSHIRSHGYNVPSGKLT